MHCPISWFMKQNPSFIFWGTMYIWHYVDFCPASAGHGRENTNQLWIKLCSIFAVCLSNYLVSLLINAVLLVTDCSDSPPPAVQIEHKTSWGWADLGNTTGRLKKNALIENRYKTPIKKLNWVESAVFLLINNHCDKGNTYLCLGECFMGVLGVFHKYFEGASRAFQKRF